MNAWVDSWVWSLKLRAERIENKHISVVLRHLHMWHFVTEALEKKHVEI